VHTVYIRFVYNDELYIYAYVEISIMFCSVLLTVSNMYFNLMYFMYKTTFIMSMYTQIKLS